MHKISRMYDNHRIVAIILSYLRPFNIQRICDVILEVDIVSRLIVSNNNPTVDLKQFISIDDPRFVLIEQSEKKSCFERFVIAKAINSDFYFSIDDDLFIKEFQIKYLIEKLIDNPGSPHGFWGQNYIENETDMVFTKGICNEERQVDILNRLYFFNRSHLKKMFSLIKSSGIKENEVGFCDDLFLSFSGDKRPQIHYIGNFQDCSTSNTYSIAEWRKDNFTEKRKSILKRILEIRHF